MFRVTIPIPCHEDWNQMNPVEQGRHCNVCSKTVVDFTSMTDEQVRHYLIDKQHENPCGRFKASQLYRIRIELPHNILEMQMPWWKRFLVASLIVFSSTLFSCDVSTGKAKIDEADKFDMNITSGVILHDMDKMVAGGMGIVSDSAYKQIVDTPPVVLIEPDTLLPYPTDSADYILSGVPIYVPDSTIYEPEEPGDEIQVIDTTVENCDVPPV